MKIKPETTFILAAMVAATLGVIYVLKRGVGSVAQDIGSGIVNAAGGVTAGVVFGVGDAVGVPRTDMSECERAKAEGRTWDASFACAAGDFLKYAFSGNQPQATSQTQLNQANDPLKNDDGMDFRYF